MSVPHRGSISIAANRAPITYVDTDDGIEPRTGVGSVAASLHAAAETMPEGLRWFASTTTAAERLAASTRQPVTDAGYELYFVEIDEDTYREYNDSACTRILWVLHHDLWNEPTIRPVGAAEVHAWKTSYHAVNRAVAHAVVNTGETSAALFHDYHFAIAPRYVQALRPDLPVAHFVHSPFASRQEFERLPDGIGRELVSGMLGADLLGFQTRRWADAFLDVCVGMGFKVDGAAGTVAHDGRTSWTRVYPIPIQKELLSGRSANPSVRAWARRFRSSTRGPLVVRCDRTDPSKNILRGLEAFGMVLDRRADLRSSRLVALLTESRQSLAEYRSYMAEIQRTIGAVNGRHPGSIMSFTGDDRDRAFGALMEYDVLLVNPIRDGMNLVAKEGVFLNRRSGVLVLSQGAGAYDELAKGAVAVADAKDVGSTAAAIERALDMGATERGERAARLRAAVGGGDIVAWFNAQVADLRAVTAERLGNAEG